MKTDASISQESRQLASKMHNELQNPENFAEFIEQGGRDIQLIESQAVDLSNTAFQEGRKVSGDAANLKKYKDWGNPTDFKPPYKIATVAEDIILPINKKIYCVEYVGQTRPGGWLSENTYNSLEEAREKLALIDDFKSSSKGEIVIREYIIIKQLPVRKGITGGMWCRIAKKNYSGGDVQYEFWFSGSDISPTWQNYLKRTGIEKLLK